MANTTGTTRQLRRKQVRAGERSPFRRATQRGLQKSRRKRPVITESDIPVLERFKIPQPRGKFLPNTPVLRPQLIIENEELRKRMRRTDI